MCSRANMPFTGSKYALWGFRVQGCLLKDISREHHLEPAVPTPSHLPPLPAIPDILSGHQASGRGWAGARTEMFLLGEAAGLSE